MEWFRIYTRTLDSAKVQSLPLALFKAWFNLCCLARVHDGPLPPFKEIAFRLRMTERQVHETVMALEAANLIDRNDDGTFLMHDWDEHQRVSDNVAQRVAKHRAKQRSNVTRNEHVTPQNRADTEQNRTETEAHVIDPKEYPKTCAAIAGKFPTADMPIMTAIVHAAMQVYVSSDSPRIGALTDSDIAEAVVLAGNGAEGQKSAGLFRTTVPAVIANWVNFGKPGAPKKPIKVVPYDPLGIGAHGGIPRPKDEKCK